ncbi:hypothetical protein D3C74_414170 [compost metagenome]
MSTEKKTRPDEAPKLRRMPISRIRYRTVTSAMLTSPSPPSSRAIALTPRMTHLVAPSIMLMSGLSMRLTSTCVPGIAPVRSRRTASVSTSTVSGGTQSSSDGTPELMSASGEAHRRWDSTSM